MKLIGLVLGAALAAVAYLTWDLSWTAVAAVGVVGIVCSQAGHATGWREIVVTAGTTCLAVAGLGAALLLLGLFMG